MTAILDPVTPDDVEHYAGTSLDLYASQVGAVMFLDVIGRHLEAAAGRAIHGARWAAVVARTKRRDFAAAVAEWEASPDSSTRGMLNAADDMDDAAALSAGMR